MSKFIALMIVVMLSMSGCMTTEKYEVVATVPAYTYDEVYVDIDIVFEVRCGLAESHFSVMDTYGQIAMFSSFLTMDERVQLERFLGDYAEDICS